MKLSIIENDWKVVDTLIKKWLSFNLFSYEGVIPKHGVLRPREGSPIRYGQWEILRSA